MTLAPSSKAPLCRNGWQTDALLLILKDFKNMDGCRRGHQILTVKADTVFLSLTPMLSIFLLLTTNPRVCIRVLILKISLIILSPGTLASNFLQACWSSFSAVKIRVWVADNERICYRNPRSHSVSLPTGIFKVRQQRLKSLSPEAHVSVPAIVADPTLGVIQRGLLM